MSLFRRLDKKKLLISALILALLILALAGSLLINSANANPVGLYYPWGPPPKPIVEVIEIDTDKHTLTFKVRKGGPWITPYGMGADYQPNREWEYNIVSTEVFVDGKIWSRYGWVTSPITVSLTGLSNGQHTLKVIATADGGAATNGRIGIGGNYVSQGSSGLIEFVIDNVASPTVSILSLKASAADKGDFQFAYRVVGNTLSWMGYSLDGKGNVTITQADLHESSLGSQGTVWTGNLTLTGLSSGLHNLVVYARDQFEQTGASKNKEFTVGEPLSEESAIAEDTLAASFPTTFLGGSIIASVALVSFGLVAYFVRGNRRIQK